MFLPTSNTLKNNTTKVYDNISLSTSLQQIVNNIGTVTIQRDDNFLEAHRGKELIKTGLKYFSIAKLSLLRTNTEMFT